MYGACNKLFASSRFASDEDGCVRRGDLCYTREYASQTSRSSDNLIEHRGFTRSFARSDVVVLESLFGPPEIRDEYSDGSHELPPYVRNGARFFILRGLWNQSCVRTTPDGVAVYTISEWEGYPFRVCED